MPYDELPIRVNRIAYREFSREPNLSMEEFKRRLGREVFGVDAQAVWVEDLLVLSRVFFEDRTWCQPSRLASPQRMQIDLAAERVKAEKTASYRKILEQVRQIASRHAEAGDAGRREITRRKPRAPGWQSAVARSRARLVGC